MKNQWRRFHYMAISDTRQRIMPTMRDREMGQPLAYPEAVLLTKASNPRFQGEVYLSFCIRLPVWIDMDDVFSFFFSTGFLV